MFTFLKGMKALRKAAFENTYQSIWCAGPSIESVKAVRPVKQIVEDLLK
jgi:nitronate monooxygenase